MKWQSTDPAYLADAAQGLLGLGYAPLSSAPSSPYTILDAWVLNGMKNQIGYRACPYTMKSQSYMDFGNSDVYSACGTVGPVVTTLSPRKTYMTLDLKSISVAGAKTSLPANFQPFITSVVRTWSIFDSCSSLISIPAAPLLIFKSAILASGALPSFLNENQKSQFLDGTIAFNAQSSTINWSQLPELSFELGVYDPSAPTVSRTFQLVLGPRQYIQASEDGYCKICLT